MTNNKTHMANSEARHSALLPGMQPMIINFGNTIHLIAAFEYYERKLDWVSQHTLADSYRTVIRGGLGIPSVNIPHGHQSHS